MKFSWRKFESAEGNSNEYNVEVFYSILTMWEILPSHKQTSECDVLSV